MPGPVRRRGGRPRIYPEGTTSWQRRCIARCGPCGLVVGDDGNAGEEVPQGPVVPINATTLIRPLGSGSVLLVGRMLAKHVDHISIHKEVSQFVERVLPVCSPLSSTNRRAIPSSYSLACQLGIAPRTMQRNILSAGAAILYGSRCLAGSVLSKVAMLEGSKRLEVEGVFVFVSYDETPLQARSKQGDQKKSDSRLATSKLLQAELAVGILMRKAKHEMPGEEYDFAVVNLPCFVLLLQRGTGEVLKMCLDELQHGIPC